MGLKKIIRKLNTLLKLKQCYVCKKKFIFFTKYRKGGNRGKYYEKLKIVGSNLDNFGCIYCGCHDRIRHLFMFFDKLNIWESFDNAKIMHFAPEQHLENKIKQCNPSQYIKADLFPQKNDSIKRIDATQIPFESENIDIIIANHILEHITLFEKALSEFYRVLKPGGFAILQTPFSLLLNKNFEDTGINTAPLRSFFYGQSDHVRVFGYKNLCESLKKIGFLLDFKNHNDFFKKNTGKIYGINLKEPLMLVKKPK